MFQNIKLNTIEQDEYKRVSGIFAIKKPVGYTSHDIVNIVRKKLRTQKVGHAGALDPFATGVLLILVGVYTKMSNELVHKSKEYNAEVLLGISTDTQDTEGKVIKVQDTSKITDQEIIKAINSFSKGYNQRVPLFSSVKVNGQSLRKLAYKAAKTEIVNDQAILYYKDGSNKKIDLPYKEVTFSKLKINSIASFSGADVELKLKNDKFNKDQNFKVVNITINCSKGTYIRQFAEDIGNKINVSSMLILLERTKVDDISLDDCMNIEDVPQL